MPSPDQDAPISCVERGGGRRAFSVGAVRRVLTSARAHSGACSLRRVLTPARAHFGACSLRRVLTPARAHSGACLLRRVLTPARPPTPLPAPARPPPPVDVGSWIIRAPLPTLLARLETPSALWVGSRLSPRSGPRRARFFVRIVVIAPSHQRGIAVRAVRRRVASGARCRGRISDVRSYPRDYKFIS